jgi:hypothetical protein
MKRLHTPVIPIPIHPFKNQDAPFRNRQPASNRSFARRLERLQESEDCPREKGRGRNADWQSAVSRIGYPQILPVVSTLPTDSRRNGRLPTYGTKTRFMGRQTIEANAGPARLDWLRPTQTTREETASRPPNTANRGAWSNAARSSTELSEQDPSVTGDDAS